MAKTIGLVLGRAGLDGKRGDVQTQRKCEEVLMVMMILGVFLARLFDLLANEHEGLSRRGVAYWYAWIGVPRWMDCYCFCKVL